VIFEGSDGVFGGIAVMDSGWHKLEVNVFLVQKLFQGFSTFVVKALEAGLKAGGTQFGGMEIFVASEDGGASMILDGFGKNTVAVIVIAKEQIIVAMAGWGDKASGLISVYLASGFHKHSIAKVHAFVGNWAWRHKILVRFRSWFGHWLGGALVFFVIDRDGH
jgi:hypothetical protein